MDKDTKIFFVTDIHGSELCFRKFLNAARFYGSVDALILGGDMTGKMVVPFVAVGGKYKINYLGNLVTLDSEAEFEDFYDRVAAMGYYPYKTTSHEMEELLADQGKTEALFRRLMRETLKRWITHAEEKLKDTRTKCFVMPGNDDPPEIYDGWSSSRVVLFDNCVGMLDEEHEILSVGITNRTPWKTHRETDESELAKILEGLAAKLVNIPKSVFCIHCPPYGTKIDLAPKLSQDLKVESEQLVVPVVSTAVRQFIEKYQPLVALHGHIHESPGVIKLGRTQCINPGSEYSNGVLRGAIVVLSGEKVKTCQLTTG
jgi:Icc-related predicted phosphoesterase